MKDNPITKDDVAWLITRCTGIMFAWLALAKIIPILYSLYSVYAFTYEHENAGVGVSHHAELFVFWRITEPLLFAVVLYGVIAYYLLQHGRLFTRLISRMGPGQ